MRTNGLLGKTLGRLMKEASGRFPNQRHQLGVVMENGKITMVGTRIVGQTSGPRIWMTTSTNIGVLVVMLKAALMIVGALLAGKLRDAAPVVILDITVMKMGALEAARALGVATLSIVAEHLYCH
jgi:hypothetical protein